MVARSRAVPAEKPLRVLLLEVTTTDAKAVVQALQRTGRQIEYEHVETTAAMRAALALTLWDVVISDWSEPTPGGRAALDLLKELQLNLPFIVVSGTLSAEHTVAAMRAGASDYVSKDTLDRLMPVIERELLAQEAHRSRQQVDLARRESERRMRRMIESARVGIWFFGAEGKTSFMNPRMAQILGMSAAEAAHASVADFVAVEDRPDLERRLAERAAVPGSYEQRFCRRDGSTGWGLIESSPLYDENGRFEGVLNAMTEITERKESEVARREAEHRFHRIFDSRIIGVIIANRSGVLLEANDTFLELVGRTRDDVKACSLNWRSITPPEWQTMQVSALEELRIRGSTRPFEKEYLRKDGTRVPVLVGLALLDKSRIITVVTDLTERKLAEERKAAVVETALDAVIGMDQTGSITEFNPAAERTFGYARAEVLGRKMADIIVPARLRVQEAHGLARYLATGHSSILGTRIETSALRRDGVEIPIELSVSRVGTGKAPTFVGFIRDISERRRTETALLERVRVMAFGADVGTALTSGGTLREILRRSCEAVVRHLGAAVARAWTLDAKTQVLELQASAGADTDIDGPHARITVGNFEIGRIAQERRPHISNDVQNDPLLRDAGWTLGEGMTSFAGHPLLVGGELVGVIAMVARERLPESLLDAVGSIVDPLAVRIRGKLTEQVNLALEEQLRQAQKMEAVGRLAGGIAHDFNNLLSIVLSYSELLIADLKEGDPLRDDLGEIHRAGARAAGLTRQLLMFSRQQVVSPKVLDLNDVISGLDRMLRRLVGEDVLLTSVPGPSLGHVRVDRGSIEQVIMNLVINARGAMPTGGRLTLETANVALDEDDSTGHLGARPGGYVRLSVTDTGCGMDKETQARIFEPFFTTKENGKGTGLGLSTVFGIVQQAGGNVRVHSEPDLGSTFEVYLPRVDAMIEEEGPPMSLTRLQGSETILLVEDEEGVRNVAHEILQRYGYAVIEAGSAGEALLLCEQHAGPIHLLLTDVVMPHMSGPKLARRLTLARPEMKVLCMSGYTDDAAVRHGVIDASFACLQKPITVETLTRGVRGVLDAQARQVLGTGS